MRQRARHWHRMLVVSEAIFHIPGVKTELKIEKKKIRVSLKL